MPRNRRDIFGLSERMMGMDDVIWARHANPLSVYSRFSILPLMTLSILSRVWLGWGALLPIGLVLLWTWWNPRAFGPPSSTNNWASYGTFGERLFLNRRSVPIPDHHSAWGIGLSIVSGFGAVVWIWGLWIIDPGLILAGLTLMVGGKTWFFDRMVWLYHDMSG